jgi:hypothetical protein
MSSLLHSSEKPRMPPTGRTVLITQRRSPRSSLKLIMMLGQLVGLLALVVYLPHAQHLRLGCAITPWAQTCQK